ncbi:MAG: glycosyltransferase family 2 protein [Moraxellaceae bacterium]|nr:MAG: glycosyltransferase family 2 protein [Moraxellaceae bacterium]
MVICTKNRAAALGVYLDKFNQLQSQTPWEFIVVDNDSTDNTGCVLREFAPYATMSFRFVQETIPGSNAAKNTGWKLALGEFIAFTDDDCYPESDYIDAVLQGLSAKDTYGFVGGWVLLFDPTDLPITIQTCNTYITYAPRSFLAAGVIHGANFAFRHIALEAAGGFDIRFGAGRKYPCEDVDVMAEILRLGWEGV